MKQYFNDPKDSTSLPGNVVYWIYTDKDGDMWFACGTKGIAKYNYTRDCFEKLPQYQSVKKSKYGSPVWRVSGDQMGRIYLACGGACYRFSKKTNKIEDLTPLFKGEIDDYGVAMFVPQGKNILWVLTDNGLFCYDLFKNNIQHVPFDKNKLGYGVASMHDGKFINNEEMLITMERSGFVFFNTKTWKFRPAPSFLNPSTSKNFTESGSVVRDKKGRIWISNSTYGLLQYFPSTNEIYSLKKEPSYPYPYPEQEGKGMSAFEDRDGNIWYASSLQGVVWFQPDLNFIRLYNRDYSKTNSLGGNRVFSFLPVSANELLVGTNKGLSKFNTQTNQFNNLFSQSNSSGNFPSVLIKQMSNDGNFVYIASRAGLCVYNKKNGRFSKFETNDSNVFFDEALSYVHVLNKGELILINGNAARVDLKTKKCRYRQNTQTGDALFQFTGIDATAYYQERKQLWLEANNGELYEYDAVSKNAVRHNYTNDTAIKSISLIHIDSSGLLLIGTSKGLIEYNSLNKRSRAITLPSYYQNITNISTEGKEVLWLTTPKEIIRLNRSTGQFNVFDLHVLLPYAGFIQNSLWKDAQGNLWLGTDKGFCIVDTKYFKPDKKISPPHLVSFSVFDKRKTFDQPCFDLKKIKLEHNENFFSFDFSSLDFHQNSKYSYQLEGFDKDWRLASKNSATYTNVPQGTYTLHLRMQDHTGRWIESNPITVYIEPAFWETWWFLSALAVLFAFLFYAAYRFVQKRKRNKRIDSTIDYFANSLYGENSITEICWDIARNCISQLNLQDCVVYLFDEEREVLIQKAAHGQKNPKEQEIINPLEIKKGEGIAGTAASTGKPVLVKDLTKDDHHTKNGTLVKGSALAIPIIHEGKVIGVIESDHSKQNFFTSEHVKALTTIAAISANKIAEAKAEEAAKLSEIKLLEIQKLLAETQLMALRAQMNPHFVFNCLNSIQECIVTEKYGEASLYLNKFSKLFRLVLNNSSKIMISLTEEIEVLELYLTLEHMRFEKSFQYNIHVSEDLETDEILIPSMLLQPFVENALWHGLMHKPTDRILNVCFKKLSDDVFQCIIDDNGIGRRKALELKEEQSKTKRHVSKGMSICKDRIELLQKQGQHAVLQIIDKYDDAGEATGTKVIIELSSYLK